MATRVGGHRDPVVGAGDWHVPVGTPFGRPKGSTGGLLWLAELTEKYPLRALRTEADVEDADAFLTEFVTSKDLVEMTAEEWVFSSILGELVSTGQKRLRIEST